MKHKLRLPKVDFVVPIGHHGGKAHPPKEIWKYENMKYENMKM